MIDMSNNAEITDIFCFYYNVMIKNSSALVFGMFSLYSAILDLTFKWPWEIILSLSIKLMDIGIQNLINLLNIFFHFFGKKIV